MPSMANITVKNAANADVIYVAKVPSAGDRSPARWTADAASAIIGHRPTLELTTRTNGSNNGRICDWNFVYPITATVEGVTSVLARVPFKGSFTMPTNVDSAQAADAFVQLGNLLVSTLMRAAASEGYAPT